MSGMSAQTRPISQSISHAQKQKPVEWISSLIQRYQDQLPTRTGKALDAESRELLNTTHSCIINVSRHHLHLVLLALVRVLKAVNASKWSSQIALSQSRLIILQTLLECLQEAHTIPGRNMEREACMKAVLDEMWTILQGENSNAAEKAAGVVSRVGDIAGGVCMGRAERALRVLQVEESSEDAVGQALADIGLMSYVTLELDTMIKLIQMVTSLWPPRKEHLEGVCSMLSSVIWRWIERYPQQFSTLQHSPQQVVTDVVDSLFNAMNTAELKRRSVCWPVQMMLIAVSPCSLEAIAHAEQEGVSLPDNVIIKRHFVDTVSSCVQAALTSSNRSPSSTQLQYACHAAVNLCKCATYVNQSDFFVFNVVQQLVEHVKVVLLTGNRPREMDRSILVDCFVALFRLKFDNDVFRVSLSSQQSLLHLVLIESLTIIASHHRLDWWPRIEMLASRSDQLRALLLSTLERVLECEPSIPPGHLTLGMTRSVHKVSGRWRERSSTASQPNLSNICETSHHSILLAIIKLINIHPSLLIRKKNTGDDNSIESIVSGLVLLMDHPVLQTPSMQALLALHTTIPEWNSSATSAFETFVRVSSHMLFSVCQRLIHLQVSNAENVISWLKALMKKREAYLVSYNAPMPPLLLDGIVAQSLVKFEVVAFLYLWNCSADLVQCCLSLFHLHNQQSSRLPIPQTDASLTKVLSLVPPSSIVTAGRIALRKSVNKILRSLPYCDAALQEAWHETFRMWEIFTNQLVQGNKDHSEFVDHVTRVTTENSEGTCTVDAWSSMSAFLTALSHLIYLKEPNHVSNYISRLLSVLRMDDSVNRDLMCKCVKEQLSYEADVSLDHFLLHSISAQLASHSSNILFVEHIIYIVKNILSRRQEIVLRVDSTSEMINALLLSQHAVQRNHSQRIMFTRKLCSLLHVVVSNGSARRLPSQLQSRMLDCLSSALSSHTPSQLYQNMEMLQSVLDALTSLLRNMSIPIQPAPFNKLFKDLVELFTSPSLSPSRSKTALDDGIVSLSTDVNRRCNQSILTSLAALVNANPELGVTKVLDTSWTGEWRLRGWMIETLSSVLSEHLSYSSRAERQSSQVELVRLLCQADTQSSSLPLITALSASVPGEAVDSLCRACITAFSERGQLTNLMHLVMWSEAESALSAPTLFRGSTLAAKLISCCFRIFGHAYLIQTLRPLLGHLINDPSLSNEKEEDEEEEWISRVNEAADMAFSLVVNSSQQCPPRFKQVCNQLLKVINNRFPGVGVSAVARIVFLRFFNPALVSPFESSLISSPPNRRVSKLLTLVSKILQYAVNEPTSLKDSFIQPFLAVVNKWNQPLKKFVSFLVEEVDESSFPATSSSSPNLQLLFTLHSLFTSDKTEFLRNLYFVCGGSSLYSRVDALLKVLPHNIPTVCIPRETLDPSLPFFIQLSHSTPPLFAVILRRLQNVEVENACKLIGEKCGRIKWICLLDGLMCYEPPNLMKLFSADSFAHIQQVLVMHVSTQLFNKLHDNFSLLQTLNISFDPESLHLPLEGLPVLTRRLLTPPCHLFPSTLISSTDTPVTVKLYDNTMVINGERLWGEKKVQVSDAYQCSLFDHIEPISDCILTLVQNTSIISLRCDSTLLMSKILLEREKVWEDEGDGVLPPLRSKSAQLLSLAFLHLADVDVSVRSSAYRLLAVLSQCLQVQPTLQEAQCVFVPHNSLQYLETTAKWIVSHDPSILPFLLPRLLDNANLTLIQSLSHSWHLVSQLGEEERVEVIGALTGATCVQGSLSTALCHCVWPQIGALDNITLQCLLNRLLFACPLSNALQIVQAANQGGDGLASLIVERTISQLSNPESRVSLSRLLPFLLVLTFDARITFLDLHLAHLMHIITCVAGSGPLFLRSSTYTLLLNIFHSLGSSRKLHLPDEKRRSLGLFLRQLSNEDTLRLFGLDDFENGDEVVEYVMKFIHSDESCDGSDSYDSEPTEEDGSKAHTNLHRILNLIISEVIDLRDEEGRSGDWMSEWRILARHNAFEGRDDVQIRSLIAFSSLAKVISDNEMKEMMQLLVQVFKRRDSLVPIAGVALSLVRAHSLTASNSPIHRLVFWVAIVLFQLENATVYEHAIQLLSSNIATLDHMGVFEHTSLTELAMESRLALEWDLKALDQCAGLSFRANFNFALVGYLLKGLRQPVFSIKVVQLLQQLLRVSAKSRQQNPYDLTNQNVPFLLALLPFDEKVQSRFRLSFSHRGSTRSVITDPWKNTNDVTNEVRERVAVWTGACEDEEDESRVLLDPTILTTEQEQALAVTLLAILARSCPNVHLVVDYLLEAVTVFPAVIPVVECLLDQRIVGLVQSCQSPVMLSSLVKLIETSASGDAVGAQQAVFFLQQCGFAGLWRYAGAFLSTRASLQAINANLCSCLECILASL